MRDNEVAHNGEEEAVYFFTADDVDSLINEGEFIELFGMVDALDAITMPCGISCDDDVLTLRKGSTN